MEAVETTITEHYINKGKAIGEAIGQAETSKETAIKLMERGMDVAFTSQISGLSENEVKELLAELDL